jgi:hypothetical protein
LGWLRRLFLSQRIIYLIDKQDVIRDNSAVDPRPFPGLNCLQKTVDPKPNSLYIQDCHPNGPIALCDRARPSIISRIILSSCSSVDAPVRF